MIPGQEAGMGPIEQTMAQIEEFLQGFGGFQRHEQGFFAKRGSTVVGIRVEQAGEDQAVVVIEANVVEGAHLTADLLVQLLEYNSTATFGAFGLTSEGLITVHHCLHSAGLTREALLPAVLEVAKVADDWDDVIVEQAGGHTAIERLNRVKPTIEPARRDEE